MEIFGIKWKWNVPNSLSLVRILLVPCFTALYILGYDGWAFAALLLSGITDFLDGQIARHFNQITDCGKLLDPIADKLTQVAVVISLTTRYKELLILAVICFVKELCQAIGGVILLHKRSKVRGSKWFGKVSTVVFYACMLAVVMWKDMPVGLWWSLIGLAGGCMVFAFVAYMRLFIKIYRAEKAGQTG